MSAGDKFQRLTEIMARLRSPEGCPWDRQQSFDSIKPYLLEETYEVLDAIDARNWRGLAEELGDLLLEAVFFAQMAAEQKLFSIEDSLDAINQKLERRHPHVFGTGSAKTPEEVKLRWDEIKAQEKAEKSEKSQAPELLGSVPRSLPALAEAAQLTARAAGVGFDWPNAGQVLEKLDEELKELAEARGDQLEGEFGDVLFVLVNLARFLKVDPEQALRRTNRKFRERFSYVERSLQESGKTPAQATLEEMDALWNEAKRKAE
ncbi:MAG: nucleoside triphosphate pyrophosphohydrolase [Bryobacteraceae bacterium]